MASQWKIDTANQISIDLGPYDIYGATGFTLHYKLKGAVNTTDSGATWTEVVHNVVAPVSFSTVGITAVGSATIEVDDGTGIEPGQVYQAGSVYIYVSSISATTITLRRLAGTEIAAATSFSQVGNTGIYETDLTLTALGQYLLIISNPGIGLLNEGRKIEIVANTVDDLASTISTNDTSIDAQLESIQNALGVVDTSVTGTIII